MSRSPKCLYLLFPVFEPEEQRNWDELWRACRRGPGKHWGLGIMNDLPPVRLF